MKPRLIFIHGMFLNPKCWEAWVSRFEEQGYVCEAPAWPLHEGEPAELRARPPEGLGRLELRTVYTHYKNLLRAGNTGEGAIVIGHSLGGLIMQKLMADGLVRLGVGICSVAPNAMLSLDWGFLRNSASITNPFAGDEPYEMTEERFRENFGNQLSAAASRTAFETYALSESRQCCGTFWERRARWMWRNRIIPCSSSARRRTGSSPTPWWRGTRRPTPTSARIPNTGNSRAAATSSAASPTGRKSPP